MTELRERLAAGRCAATNELDSWMKSGGVRGEGEFGPWLAGCSLIKLLAVCLDEMQGK